MSASVNLDRVDVRKLTLKDDTAVFSCGQPDLDEYIWYQAQGQQLESAAVVYVACLGEVIVGFISLSMSSIKASRAYKQEFQKNVQPRLECCELSHHTMVAAQFVRANPNTGAKLADELFAVTGSRGVRLLP